MTPPDIQPLAPRDTLTRASAALGKVDLYGRRGVTMLSFDECEAMAVLLAALGLVPTQPGNPAPQAFFFPVERTVK